MGRLESVEECAEACTGVSSMFIFGTNDFGKKRCNRKGCKCYCETSAATDGTCNVKNHRGYRLYRYDTWGNYFHYSISCTGLFGFHSSDISLYYSIYFCVRWLNRYRWTLRGSKYMGILYGWFCRLVHCRLDKDGLSKAMQAVLIWIIVGLKLRLNIYFHTYLFTNPVFDI